MNLENTPYQSSEIVEIQCDDRWQVYFRLQELNVPCWCAAHQSLTVQIDSAIALIHLWSVVKQTKARSHLIEWLETCWQLPQS
ncbi:Asr1405/Asl0597 family protein [Myxacorys almedinensis]|uniref:Uncharacterized protein n=1 Tax=Myxacorys almedinensis A TaxID=2690445 RepID=A0A8J8CM10_9CYAN|nr:Asr1405/Asl0597 family protein [Myxacorys almedinensis]NDJ18260.1 hypothetical protein [Myxacorys almedinensis A]